MNSATQCIVLLACLAICCSAAVIKDCQCLKTSRSATWDSIIDIKEYDPSPYCNKRQVIVMLKSGGSRCLDPKIFTKAVVLKVKDKLSKKMSTTTPKTTTSAPTTQQ